MLQLQFLNFAKPPMWLVESGYSIGKSPDSHCVLNHPSIEPNHARLVVDGENVEILPLAGSTRVNGEALSLHTTLRHGDTLELGVVVISVIDPKMLRRTPDKTAATELHLWQLQPMSTVLDPKPIRLSGTKTIGRAQDCEIHLNFAHLSRRHANLTVTPLGLEVEDLESSNGTFVNGHRVRRVLLHNGDVLSFDAVRFRIVGPEDDIEKTALRPSIPENLHPTHLLHRPSAEPNRPVIMPILHPSSASESDAIRRSRLMLIVGLGLLAAVFGSLIYFLLH